MGVNQASCVHTCISILYQGECHVACTLWCSFVIVSNVWLSVAAGGRSLSEKHPHLGKVANMIGFFFFFFKEMRETEKETGYILRTFWWAVSLSLLSMPACNMLAFPTQSSNKRSASAFRLPYIDTVCLLSLIIPSTYVDSNFLRYGLILRLLVSWNKNDADDESIYITITYS